MASTGSRGNFIKTIVCIEDDGDIVDLLMTILDSPTLNVISSATASEGLAVIKRVEPALVLLDLRLLDTDGWFVYDNMRGDSALRNIPIILLTAYRREFQPRRHFQETDLDIYFTKPFDPIRLRELVEHFLGEKIW